MSNIQRYGKTEPNPSFLQFLIQALRQRSLSPNPTLPPEMATVGPVAGTQQQTPPQAQIDPSVQGAQSAMEQRRRMLQGL